MMSGAVAETVHMVATQPVAREFAQWCVEMLSDDMADLVRENVYLADQVARRPGDFDANVRNFLAFVKDGCPVWPAWAEEAEQADDNPLFQLVAARMVLSWQDSLEAAAASK